MNKIKVLHYSTHNEDCGIGKYQEQFLAAMTDISSEHVYNEFFNHSPNVTKTMSHDEFTGVLQQLKEKLKEFDILHIQHELSFYRRDELDRIVTSAKAMGKKVVMTVHTAPAAQYQEAPRRQGISPRSFLHYIRLTRIAREFNNVHLEPMRKVDLNLVHNTMTKDDLIKHGVVADKIKVIQHPVPMAEFAEISTEIREALSYKDGDVIFATIGFLSRMKGVDKAIRALSYLPDTYKLAVIGGIHPGGGGEALLDELCELIVILDLKDRVYITGFVEDDKKLHALIRECDVCVYPYDPSYYSYVTSGALFQAIANNKAVIAYPTKPFIEMNKDHTIAITKSSNYYELARYLKVVDIAGYEKKAKAYASKHSYNIEAKGLVAIYTELLRA